MNSKANMQGSYFILVFGKVYSQYLSNSPQTKLISVLNCIKIFNYKSGILNFFSKTTVTTFVFLCFFFYFVGILKYKLV